MNPFLSIKEYLSFLLVGLLVSDISAHTDTKLKFENGEVIGLPPDFRPAKFDVTQKKLTIANKELILPEILHSLFHYPKKGQEELDPFNDDIPPLMTLNEVSFQASWYHGPSILPPYMVIKIKLDDQKEGHRIEILIDLVEVTIIEATAYFDLGRRAVGLPIKLIEDTDPFDLKTDHTKTPITGKWTNYRMALEITETQLILIDTPDPQLNISGKIEHIKPSEFILIKRDDTQEKVFYNRSKDILYLGFSGGDSEFVLSGSPTDQLYRRLNQFHNQPEPTKK